MISSSIMRLVLVMTIVFLVKIEGTTQEPKSSHYSGRRILSTSDKKNIDSYNNYLHLMQSNSYSSSGGNRRLDPYYTDNDLDIESNSSNSNDGELDLNSWNDSQHHTVTKHNNNNYKDTNNNNNNNNYEGEDTSSISDDQYNSLYYEPSSYSPAIQESSWPYSNNYYTEDVEKTTTSTPSGYYESSPAPSFPSYIAPTYGQSTEAPFINPVETELIAEEEEENGLDSENVFSKIRKTIKDMAANVGLCTGSFIGCFICVATFGGFPTLGPLPYSCITSCSLGIFTNCARFDLFSHFQG